MKVLELFGGIGACTKALKRLNIPIDVVDYVEIDKYAVASYNAINGTNFEPQDITEWNKDIEADLIMHGSPCQDFSIAGRQAGADEGTETRSSLMWETVRIIERIKPKYVIWENVKNVLSKKHRHNFDKYIDQLDKLGYNSYYQVLNAKDYGIPQNRERVFTISIRKDVDENSFMFPEKEELKLRLKDMLESNVDEKYYISKALNLKLTSNYIQYSNSGKMQNSQAERAYYQDDECMCSVPHCNTNGDKTQIVEKDKQEIVLEGAYARNFGSKGKLQDTENVCDTLQAAMGTGGGNVPIIRMGGLYGQTTRWGLYDDKGLAPTLVAAMGEGGGYIPMIPTEKPKVITHNIQQTVKVRMYPVDVECLKSALRAAKLNVDLNNKQIAEMLNIPQTQVEHYFRRDSSFAIPSPEIWLKLKEVLKIESNYFDESIMTFEEKEGVYEKANRVYDEEGLAPTLTQQEEKILIKNANKKGYDEAVEGDSINLSYPTSTTRRGRVGHQISQTIQCDDMIGVVENERAKN